MTEKKPCGECGTLQRITAKGLIFKHGECDGGGKSPITPEHIEEVALHIRKTGYTDEQLERMLSDLTPKRQKIIERIKRFLSRGH